MIKFYKLELKIQTLCTTIECNNNYIFGLNHKFNVEFKKCCFLNVS